MRLHPQPYLTRARLLEKFVMERIMIEKKQKKLLKEAKKIPSGILECTIAWYSKVSLFCVVNVVVAHQLVIESQQFIRAVESIKEESEGKMWLEKVLCIMGPKKKTNLFYGKAKSYLVCNFPIPAHLNMGCRNGHVLHILATNNDSYQQIAVSSLSNSDSSQESLSRLRADQVSPRKKVMRKRLTILENEIAIKKRKHKEDLKGLREKLTFTETKFFNQKTMLSQQLADKNSAILVLQNDILVLQEKFEDIQQVTQNTKNKKCYSADIRTLIYDMLMCQAPTHSVPSLLHKIGEHTGYQFSQIPHRTTVEQMMRELGVLSDLQTAEIAFTTKDLTLGFDATTQEGVHVNAVHLTTESVCMVVAIDQLPGGTAYDYQSHITKSVDNLAKLYSDFYKLKYTDVKSTIIGNITNTMSDRVATNHATVSKLNLVWQKSLNELNCHLHPLDTMTSSCKSSLKALETSKGKFFGKDCIAANIVVQLNKLRYKDAKGDPKGFVTFLDQHELPRGLLPRYRGNRLHILFHTCGILIHHYAILKIFLCSGLALCGGLRNSLFQDFTSEIDIPLLFTIL
nr:unnamed protein product [Hydra vulgaris]